MEQKIFTKFNLYDQIGYLMVGAIGLLLVAFNVFYFFDSPLPALTLDTFLVWFVVAYFFGHLIQGVANLFNEIKWLRLLVPENKNDFTEKQKEILGQAKEFFSLSKQDENAVWNMCYMLSNAKDVTGQVQSFNSYYSLYRGWFVAFFFESLFLSYFLIVAYEANVLLLFLANIFAAVIFYRRALRFWKYTRNKVLETFVVVKKLNL